MGLFQDSDFVCLEVEHLFPSVGRARSKQTSVSHSSTESEVISLYAGLRMDEIPTLDQREVVIDVLHSSKHTHTHTLASSSGRPLSKRSTSKYCETRYAEKSRAQILTKKRFTRSGNRDIDELSKVDHVVTSASSSTRDERNHFLRLFNIMNSSMFSCSVFLLIIIL